MNLRSVLSVVLILCSLLLSISAASQNLSSPFIIKTYTAQDGLPDLYNFSVKQDSRGYVWVGGLNGLSRFDGNNFYKYDMGNEIKNITVSVINENEKGQMWIYSGSSIYMLNGQKFYPFEGGRPLHLTLVYSEKNPEVMEWWTLTKSGYQRVDGTSTFKAIPVPGLGKGDCRRAVVTDSGWYYNFWNDIIFAGTNGDRKTVKELLPSFYYIVIMCYRNRQLYFYTDNGVYVYRNGQCKSLFRQQLAGKRIYTAYLDHRNRIWVATESDGIFISESGQEERLSYNLKLSHNLVSSFYSDNEGNIWITYFEGLVKVREMQYEIFSKKDYPFLADLNSISKNTNGDIFFFSETNGLAIYSNNRFLYSDTNLLKGHLVDFLCLDEKKRFWCRTRQQKLILIDREKISLITKKSINDSFMAGRSIIYDDFRKKIWYPSTYLFLGDEKNFTVFKDQTSKPIQGPDHIIYIGEGRVIVQTTFDEMLLIDSNNRVTNINPSDSIVPTRIHKLFTDMEGNIWISYPGTGLLQAKLINNRLEIINKITVEDGRKNDVIQSMAFDKRGRIWISTMAGIEVMVKRTYDDGYDYFIYGLNQEHNIPSGGLVYGRLICDNDGDMWFSTQNAVIKFHVNKIQFTTPPPHISIENVLLNNGKSEWNQYADSSSGIFRLPVNPAFKYYENTLSIEFKAVSMINSGNFQYNFMLKGSDKSWSKNFSGNVITFSKLNPGTYTFFVKARKSNSDWSEPASFTFTIRRALWQHWWFNPSLLVIIVGFFYWLYRFRLNQLQKEKKIRNQLASDLHDDIGSTLSSISYYSEAIKQQVKETNPQVISLLDKMETASDSTVNAMSDIVWATNPAYDKGSGLLNRMQSYASEICGVKNIRLEFEADKSFENVKLNMNIRKNIFLIFKEAANNAVKYSGCTKLSVHLSQDEMQIKDNGKGFDLRQDFAGNGLKNMQIRAREIKASLQIIPEEGKGCSIVLKL